MIKRLNFEITHGKNTYVLFFYFADAFIVLRVIFVYWFTWE